MKNKSLEELTLEQRFYTYFKKYQGLTVYFNRIAPEIIEFIKKKEEVRLDYWKNRLEELKNEKCTPGNCPFHPQSGVWGMGPGGMEEMRIKHEKYHGK